MEPRATEYIPQIVEMVRTLEEKGLAYKAEDGSVYYSVSKFRGYGKLSGRRTEEMIAGARVDIEEMKRDPLDFALWKRSKEGEPWWESPWSKGRPGWHIECSAMSTDILGKTLDIHGGGRDLIFPHHENEIAQSEGAYDVPFVRFWVHNGFVTISGEKMSKSLGNFLTHPGAHFRGTSRDLAAAPGVPALPEPDQFFKEAIQTSNQAMVRFYELLDRINRAARIGVPTRLKPLADAFADNFDAAMSDDFNTAKAIAQLHDLTTEINRELDSSSTISEEDFPIPQYCLWIGFGSFRHTGRRPLQVPRADQTLRDRRYRP